MNTLTRIIAASALLVAVEASAQPVTYELAFFRTDWCPSASERLQLLSVTSNYYAKPGTCCLDRAVLPAGVTPAQFAQQFPRGYSETEDKGVCTGYRPTDEEAARMVKGEVTYDELLDRQKVAQAKKAADDEKSARAQAASDEAAYIASIPSEADGQICMEFGRESRPGGSPGRAKALGVEISKRKLTVSRSKVIDRKISIGDSICTLYGAFGLPEASNRTVTAAGAHIQHVYGRGNYVYTVNGRVTSWQD